LLALLLLVLIGLAGTVAWYLLKVLCQEATPDSLGVVITIEATVATLIACYLWGGRKPPSSA